MEAMLIDGLETARQIRAEISRQVAFLAERNVQPGLAVVLVGEDPASQSYVTGKAKACLEHGIRAFDHTLPATVPQKDLLELLRNLNADPLVHGILVQLPLPKHIDEQKIIAAINPDKDVDGFHPISVGKMLIGLDTFLPCTPHGIVQLLKVRGLKTAGKHVVVIGRSNLVGKPIAAMLLQKGDFADATVTVCHSRTVDLAHHVKQADIIIAAIGRAKMITADMVKTGAVVIDVGVNRVPDATKKSGYRLVGDVDFEAVRHKASYITPVPGGVGPMTITMLLYNTVESAFHYAGLKKPGA
jgi:methylenetetrahydrofolate dehydrogenase (NADP+)/methenyltetrahydrofolate cyclohydrolase